MPKQSELKRLSEQQKATVLGWIDDGVTLREAIEKIAKPQPEGFEIRTNLGTLSRVIGLWRSEQLLKARPEEAERARALLKNDEDSIAFQRATITVLQQRMFESAMKSRDGREQRETLRMLLEHEIKIRKLELAEKKLEESKRQFEFNAARLAMKYWHEFREIDEIAGHDDEEKIWMARDVMFVGPNGENPVRPAVAGALSDEPQISQISQIGEEKKSSGEIVHKLSPVEAGMDSNGSVKIEENAKTSEPAEAGTTCGEPAKDPARQDANDEGKPNDRQERKARRKSEREH
jgi:hypothetical protein